jgi:hypothetical protein
MPIVWIALKIDVLKMEQMFQMGYKEGKKVFFCLTYKLARLTRVHVEL